MNFRKSPAICIIVAITQLLFGHFRLSKEYLGKTIKMEDGSEYNIFRHLTKYPLNEGKTNCVFIVSFKFASLSHSANKLASIIPMLMIAGFPGFITKVYAVNKNNGFWQGMYQWRSINDLEEYIKSFVFRIMNKRVKEGTLNSFQMNNKYLSGYIEEKIIRHELHYI